MVDIEIIESSILTHGNLNVESMCTVVMILMNAISIGISYNIDHPSSLNYNP